MHYFQFFRSFSEVIVNLRFSKANTKPLALADIYPCIRRAASRSIFEAMKGFYVLLIVRKIQYSVYPNNFQSYSTSGKNMAPLDLSSKIDEKNC